MSAVRWTKWNLKGIGLSAVLLPLAALSHSTSPLAYCLTLAWTIIPLVIGYPEGTQLSFPLKCFTSKLSWVSFSQVALLTRLSHSTW